MRTVLFVIAGLLILIGGVWFFQGIGVIRGSYMTGQGRWALYGGLAFVVGLVILVLSLRRRAVKSGT
jgi:hypothetical protein